MTWIFVILLTVAVLAVLLFVLKVPKGTREAVAAALLLGLAGYVTQGSPALDGAPREAKEPVSANPTMLVEGRAKVSNSSIPTLNRWVVVSDAFMRNGEYANAAEVLRGTIEEDPKNSEAWLAMANALLAHADNALTPASVYAYRQATRADPKAPGPPFFLGLALAQQGRLGEARDLWAGLVARAPDDAPWRAPLAAELQRLDAVIAAQKAESTRGAPAPEGQGGPAIP